MNDESSTQPSIANQASSKQLSFQPILPTFLPKKSLIISVVIAILLLAINMRAPIIGFGAVAKWVQHDLALTTRTIGMLGTIPVMAFALSSFIAPMVSRRLGLENTLTMAAFFLATGIFLRSWQPHLAWLLIGTVILSLAISLGNVLVSAAIKKYTPNKISLVMGTYSLFLSLFAGVSAGVMPMLSELFDWQFALSSWGWISVAALVAWLWVLHLMVRHNLPKPNQPASPSSEQFNQQIAYLDAPAKRSVWTMPMAWFISIYMGLQSLLYYTLASFLPSLLMDKGVDSSQVSHTGMLFQMVAFPSIILLSKWVSAGWNIRVLAVSAAVSNLMGVIGFGFLSVQWAWLWAIFAGFGCGVIFTLCMMLFTIKARDSQQAAELSGMAQSVGYGIAILGPILTGWLKDLTHGWQVPMLVLLGLMLIKCVVSWFATRDKPIDS